MRAQSRTLREIERERERESFARVLVCLLRDRWSTGSERAPLFRGVSFSPHHRAAGVGERTRSKLIIINHWNGRIGRERSKKKHWNFKKKKHKARKPERKRKGWSRVANQSVVRPVLLILLLLTTHPCVTAAGLLTSEPKPAHTHTIGEGKGEGVCVIIYYCSLSRSLSRSPSVPKSPPPSTNTHTCIIHLIFCGSQQPSFQFTPFLSSRLLSSMNIFISFVSLLYPPFSTFLNTWYGIVWNLYYCYSYFLFFIWILEHVKSNLYLGLKQFVFTWIYICSC